MTATDPSLPALPDETPAPLPAEAPIEDKEVSEHSLSDGAPASPTAPQADQSMTPQACAERLKSLFPALFGGAARPVKLRIQADIQARAPGVFTRSVLSAFLRRHTGSTSYLIALTREPQRLDLDGQPAGEISAEHRQAAAEELARRRALRETRRQADEAARRERALLLRAFETTTLTRENFCALKGIAPDTLDGLLAQARQEAAEARDARPGRDPREGGPRPAGARRAGPGEAGRPSGPGQRRDGGGPRPESAGPRPPRRGR